MAAFRRHFLAKDEKQTTMALRTTAVVGGCHRMVLAATALVLLSVGCRSPYEIRDYEYAEVVQQPSSTAGFLDIDETVLPTQPPEISGPHSVDEYLAWALLQNPSIQAARKQVEAMAMRVPQVSSLSDPMLEARYLPEEVQTAAGEQRFQLMASQRLPWPGRLATRSSEAEAETNISRAQLAAAELKVIEQVRLAYYDLYYYQQALRLTKQDKKLLEDLSQIAEARYRTGNGSQQDLLRAQLAISTLDEELLRLQQRKRSVAARLAEQLHVAPNTPLETLEELAEVQVPLDLDRLFSDAMAMRPELHAELAALERDRHKVELARLDYYPDVTASVAWLETESSGISPVANGRDPWILGLGVNLPIYRNRLDAQVRQAEATVVADARRYDAMRDDTLGRVADLFYKLESQQELLDLFQQDILPRAEQTLEASIPAYQVGDVDFLTLLDNWRQVLRFQLSHHLLKTELRQTLASLETVVGGSIDRTGERTRYQFSPSGCVRLDYCPPAPLPYSGYSACPTPIAMQYGMDQLEQEENSDLPPVPNNSGFPSDERSR